MPGVELRTNEYDGHVVVALRGELDITDAADAEAAITALAARGRYLIVDMSALDFIDYGSLGALLRVQWLAWSTGGDVVLAAPQRHVLRLLALTGRDHAFLVQASVEAAVAGIASRRTRDPLRRHAVCTARPRRAREAAGNKERPDCGRSGLGRGRMNLCLSAATSRMGRRPAGATCPV
jgi:anti-sigma B factor antagonist